MKLVNIGCGEVFHPAWINLDIAPISREVRRLDARKPLPFGDGEVDAVYHSHVLEHLGPAEAEAFLRECRRILRRGGIIRVVVPDLEGIARAYLQALEAGEAGGDGTAHEWGRLELPDQLARSVSGGEMVSWVRRLSPEGHAIIRRRAGRELDGMLNVGLNRGVPRNLSAGRIFRWLHLQAVRGLVLAAGGRRRLSAFDEGVFRQRGEVHRVMYDRLSLARVLERAGFGDIRKAGADESRIEGYPEYGLDAVDGDVRKPDSLFMEATRS